MEGFSTMTTRASRSIPLAAAPDLDQPKNDNINCLRRRFFESDCVENELHVWFLSFVTIHCDKCEYKYFEMHGIYTFMQMQDPSEYLIGQ